MLKIIKKDGNARLCEFETAGGTVPTPAYQNVATCAAIKGALSALVLNEIGRRQMLCNAYHLHVRPGDEIIKDMGGLRRFTGWDGPILTDSGGLQFFSLAILRRFREDGVYFYSHVDGRHILL